MKYSVWPRILCIGTGGLLLAMALVVLCNPASVALSLAWLMGLSILAAGGMRVFMFARWRDAVLGAGWVLAEGLFSIMVGLLLLCNQWVAASAVPLLFSMWMLCSGIGGLVRACDLKMFALPGWRWQLALGLIKTALGLVSFFQPVVAAVALSIPMGVFFLLQALGLLLEGLLGSRS